MSIASNKKLVDIKRKYDLKTGWNEAILTVPEMRKNSKDSKTAIINMFKDLRENTMRREMRDIRKNQNPLLGFENMYICKESITEYD